MKVLIWIGCIVTAAFLQLIIVSPLEKNPGDNLLLIVILSGGIGVLCVTIARKCCQAYDAYKAKKAPPSDESEESSDDDNTIIF